MHKADYLLRLMKQQTDALVAKDDKLQQFLIWVNEKSLSVEVPYKLVAVKAFYFAVAVARDMANTRTRALSGSRDLARSLNLNINNSTSFDVIVDLNLGRIFARAHALNHTFDDAFVSNLDFTFFRPFTYIFNLKFDLKFDLEFEQELQQLMIQLPDPFDVNRYMKDVPVQKLPLLKTHLTDINNEEIFKKWWQANGQAWTEELRAVMINHRNIGHDWQFSNKQIQVLKQYYNANKLLVDCLNSSCNVTPAVRNEIEDTLLLPIAEIKKLR